MNERKSSRHAALILVLLLAIAGVITFAVFVLPNMARSTYLYEGNVRQNSELLNLARVESLVYSEEDGDSHPVSVDFTLAVDEKVKSSLDTDAIQARIKDSMNRLNYDMINDKGGLDYIKTEVIKDLDGVVNEEDLRGLYIRAFKRSASAFDYIDMGAADSDSSPGSKTNVNDILQGFGKRK